MPRVAIEEGTNALFENVVWRAPRVERPWSGDLGRRIGAISRDSPNTQV